MIRLPVVSSNIASMGYDADRQVLEVEFVRKGDAPAAVYVYYDVPASVYDAVVNASSVGGAFGKLIKNAEYHFEKVEG